MPCGAGFDGERRCKLLLNLPAVTAAALVAHRKLPLGLLLLHRPLAASLGTAVHVLPNAAIALGWGHNRMLT